MYNIFKNDFYDTKPAPKWAFTVEFLLAEELQETIPGNSPVFNNEDPDLAPPEWLDNLVEKLRSSTKSAKLTWMDKLQKSVSKIPIQHPEHQNVLQLFFPGYQYEVTGRYQQSGMLDVTFNDNIDRDIRCILEQLMNFEGFRYRRVPDDGLILPTLPSIFKFDMLVRVYDVERVNQYDPSDNASDEVSENGTVQSFFYEGCYVSKIGSEKHSYESSDKPITVEATIAYQRMTPMNGSKEI